MFVSCTFLSLWWIETGVSTASMKIWLDLFPHRSKVQFQWRGFVPNIRTLLRTLELLGGNSYGKPRPSSSVFGEEPPADPDAAQICKLFFPGPFLRVAVFCFLLLSLRLVQVCVSRNPHKNPFPCLLTASGANGQFCSHQLSHL